MAVVTRCDMALHQAIWRLADSSHLLRDLDSVLGAVFVLCDRATGHGPYNVEQMLAENRRLVRLIGDGDGEGAGQAIKGHLRNALSAFLRARSDRAQQDLVPDGQPG